MSLMRRLGLISGLSLASALFSGCAGDKFYLHDPNVPRDPGANSALLGVIADAASVVQLGQGNLRGSLVSAGTGTLLAGNAEYERNRAIAEANRTQVTVNPQNQMPAEIQGLIPTNQNQLRIYEGYDKNNNNHLDGEEEIGKERYSFNSNECIVLTATNLGSSSRHVRYIISKNGNNLFTSDFYKNPANMELSIAWFPLPPNLTQSGDYEVRLYDNEDKEIGKRVFNVKPSASE